MAFYSAHVAPAYFGAFTAEVQGGEESEAVVFAARAAALAGLARRQRLQRLALALGGLWARISGMAMRRRLSQVRRLQDYPDYLLQDIGVTRSFEGRLVHETATGRGIDLLAPAAARHAARTMTAGFRLALN